MSGAPLEDRSLENLRRLELPRAPARALVAFSGGLDSTVLLHLLRFRVPDPPDLQAAHFDHRMRPGSDADAAWVADLCRDWDVPLVSRAADPPPRAEADARDARYRFLFAAADTLDARVVVTAHHADDQAETVLFRILRGTGLAGLAGIPERGRRGLLRPLLPFWRHELETYARTHQLRWREDPTNETLGPVRNRIRHRILPELERSVAPNLKQNLVTLADLARESEAAWRVLVRTARGEAVRRDNTDVFLSRTRFVDYPPALRTRLLRDVLRTLGIVLDRPGTRSAVQFITDASSGREMQLPRGFRITIEFDRARVHRSEASPAGDRPVWITELEPGRQLEDQLRLGGREYRVRVRQGSRLPEDADPEAIWGARIALSGLRFPLLLRGRMPGDRVRTAGGTKSVKKLMIERRIPLGDRARLPLLIDAEGAVLWIGGIGGFAGPPSSGRPELNLAVYDD